MTGWRDHLAAIRARHAGADSSTAGAIGTIGTNGTGEDCPIEARAAFYARFAAEAAAALAAPDPELAAERALMAQHYAAPTEPPGGPDPLRDGLLRGARDQRPPG